MIRVRSLAELMGFLRALLDLCRGQPSSLIWRAALDPRASWRQQALEALREDPGYPTPELIDLLTHILQTRGAGQEGLFDNQASTAAYLLGQLRPDGPQRLRDLFPAANARLRLHLL